MIRMKVKYNTMLASFQPPFILSLSLSLPPSLSYCLVKLHSLLEEEVALICVRVWWEGAELGAVAVEMACFPREEGEALF